MMEAAKENAVSTTGRDKFTDYNNLDSDMARVKCLLDAAIALLLEINYATAGGKRIHQLDQIEALVRTSRQDLGKIITDAETLFHPERQESESSEAGLDLSGLSATELSDLRDVICTISEVISGLYSQPRFWRDRNNTKAGDVLEKMLEKLGAQEDHVMAKLDAMRPNSKENQDAKARMLIDQAVKYGEPLSVVAALSAELSAQSDLADH